MTTAFARIMQMTAPVTGALAALALTGSAIAQGPAEPVTPVAAAPSAALADGAEPTGQASIFVAPIALDRSNRMTLPVTLAGQGPFGFIVDTGSERTVISRELAERLGLPSAGRARVIGLAEIVTADLYSIADLQLSQVPLSGLRVPAFSEYNLGAPGLIGIDSLENHRLLIDFVAGRMDLRASPRSRAPRRDSEVDGDAIVVVARRVAGRMILSNAMLDGRRIDVIVDTGAQSSVGNLALQRLVARAGGQRRGSLIAGQLTSVTGDKLDVQMGQIARITVGGFDFTDLPIAYADSPAFTTLGLNRRPALLLGMDALRLFDRVVVDFTNRRVTFDLPGRAGRGAPGRFAAGGDRGPGHGTAGGR